MTLALPRCQGSGVNPGDRIAPPWLTVVSATAASQRGDGENWDAGIKPVLKVQYKIDVGQLKEKNNPGHNPVICHIL